MASTAHRIPREDACTSWDAISQDTTLLKENKTFTQLDPPDKMMTVPQGLSLAYTLQWLQHCSGINQCQSKEKTNVNVLIQNNTAIRRWYIFIFRCRQANCKDVEVFFYVFMAFGGFVHAMHYLLVLQVHIAVEVNFYTFCALCKKDKTLSFSHLYVLFAL